MKSRPNIIYLHSHDTGRYVQPYGHAVPTPNIQRLAEEGMLFRQAFCAAPTCSPSRAALLTGQPAHSSGMLGLAHRGFTLHDKRQHLACTLKEAGYFTVEVGMQHVARDRHEIDYDLFLDTRDDRALHVAPAAASFLLSSPRQPFFFSVGFFETHREYDEPGPGEDERYCRPPAPLPDCPATRREMAAFKASARLLDDGMGQVLLALEEAGLANETLVICTTDHGIAFPGMKCTLSDHGLGVMLILRGPGGFTGGRVCDALVSHIDLYPTLCDLLEIEPPSWLRGRSLLPLARGEAQEVNEAVFGEVTYHAAYEPMRAVRTRRWKYIRRFDGRTSPVLPNTDDSLSKDLWLDSGWRERAPEVEQLYDLVFDPNEAHNLASDPRCAAALGEMRSRLADWMQASADPLLLGVQPVPAPKGAVANDPDDLSPGGPVRAL